MLMENTGIAIQAEAPEEELTIELKYLQILAQARVNIVEEFDGKLPVDEIELGHIYYDDAEEVRLKWRLTYARSWINLDWASVRKSQKRRIDVSIRCRDSLCGLMLAQRSNKKLCVTLRYLEGNPNPHPLKGYVLALAMIIAETFAEADNIRQVCVSRPEKGLIDKYESLGYELNATDKERIRRNGKPRAKLMTKRLDNVL